MRAFSVRACGRILWREAAEQYAFCIGIFALLIALQASLATMETFDMIRPLGVAFGFGMALFMTAIYTAASSALLLTAEADAGTFSFQRTKPIGWFTYLWGKLSWVVLSSILLGLVAWVETGVWLGVFPNARETSLAFGVSGVGILEGLAWGLMASMLVRGPLRAVIAGIAMASLGAWITVVVHHSVTGGGTVAVTAAYYQAAGLRLIVAAVALALAIPLVRVWYRTGQPLRLLALPRSVGDERSVAIAGEWDSCDRPCGGRAIRLVWQAWRQIRTAVVIYWGICVAILMWAGYSDLSRLGHFNIIRESSKSTVMASFAILGLSALLAGYTFGADQKARFLQLARDGVSPWEIWLSRLAIMGTVLLPPALIVLGLFWFVMTYYELTMFRSLAALLVVLGLVSVLTIGQACSMFVRSRIIALLAAPVMTACFAFWIGMGVFWLGLGWKLGALPMLLALLIGSRLLASTRLRQDNSWRAMRVPALLIVVAVVLSFQALAHHRVSEIRPYDSVIQVDNQLIDQPPEAIVMMSARRGFDRMAWDKAPRNQIEETLRLEGKPNRWMYGTEIGDPWRRNSHLIFDQIGPVRGYSDMIMAEAMLDQSLRDATSRPGIRNERLRRYIDFLDDWAAERTRHAEWLAADCQRDMSWLRYGPTENYASYGFHDEPLPWHCRWLTFERTRTLQLLDRAYRIAADRLEVYETAVINDQLGAGKLGLVSSQDILPFDPARPIWYQMSNQMILETDMYRFRLLTSLAMMHYKRYDSLYTAEAQRRGTILYLALRMYYNDKGELPESLDALVKEEYLDRLPVVPIVCKPFYYEPDGASEKRDVKSLEQFAGYTTGGINTSFLFEHDSTLPFLWYPFGPHDAMDPGIGTGSFIDLDFVEAKETE